MSFSGSFPENQDNYRPTSKEYAIREQLYEWFNHAWDFIIKETPESEWTTVKKYFLTKEKLWYKYTDLLQIIGVRFGQYTKHALVDLDSGSLIHPYTHEKAYRKAKWALEDIGLIEDVTIRSSESEGIHLCYFLQEKVPTFKLACAMRWALEQAGFEIKPGQLELFPNTKQFKKHQKGKKREFSYYNGHRLPLQKGSYLLDKDFVPYSNNVEHFLHAASVSAQNNDIELLTSTFEEAEKWFKQKYRTSFNKGNNSDYQDWLDNSLRYISEGWTDNHQTNDLLLTIANVGVKAHHLEGEELALFIENTATAAPGYYPHCRHRHEIRKRCLDVARSAEKYWSAYPSRPRRSFTYAEMVEQLEERSQRPNQNQLKSEETSRRIANTIVHLSQVLQALPRNIKTLMKLIRETSKQLFGIGVSDKTLRKKDNLPLWHPNYKQGIAETVDAELEEKTKNNDKEDSADMEEVTLEPDSCTEIVGVGEPIEHPVVTKTPVEPQQVAEPDVPRESLHSEPSSANIQSHGATPSPVVCAQQLDPESLETTTGKCLENRGYTLPYMKGMMSLFVSAVLYQLYQRSYYQALMHTPTLELRYLGYQGQGTGGLVQSKESKTRKMEIITPGTQVKVMCDRYHSSALHQAPQQLLVYITPLDADKWENGIAVLIEQLFPLRIKHTTQQTDKNNDNDKLSLYPSNCQPPAQLP